MDSHGINQQGIVLKRRENLARNGSDYRDMNAQIFGEPATQYKCTMCPENFYHATRLQDHLKKVHVALRDQQKAECIICARKLPSTDTVICNGCVTDFATELAGTKPAASIIHQCGSCDAFFDSEKELREHVREKHYGTKVELKSFKLSDELDGTELDTSEIRGNMAGRLNTILQGGKNVPVQEAIRSKTGGFVQTGQKSTLPVGRRPFKCKFCTKGFTRKEHLIRHERGHTAAKPFVCSECKQRFQKIHDLNIHLRSHAGGKPYACRKCDKRFNYPSHLKCHELYVHAGERLLKCKVCSKGFHKPSQLKHHLRVHRSGNQHVCTLCGKGFISPSQLKRHERIHTGEKPFVCSICGKCFGRSDQLKGHQKNMHANN